MVKRTALIAVLAAFSALLTTTQVTAAQSLSEQFGDTAAMVIGLGWLLFLGLLAVAIVLPLVRR